MIYYHNPRCSKSRQGIELLENKGIDFKVKEYLKEGIEEKEFIELLKKLGKSPLEGVIRTKEALFKELELTGKNLTDIEWAKIINKNPKLLERPILVNKDQAVIGRPIENFDQII